MDLLLIGFCVRCVVCAWHAVEKKKGEKGVVLDGAKKDKKVATLDEQLKARNRDLSMTKMKSTLFTGVLLLGVFAMLNNLFEGTVVAKLPFEPFSLMRSMSHRGLSGSDPTDCSFLLIYILSQMSLRAHITKFLGFTPVSSGPSLFNPPTQ
jgi:uncharacterized membrane protein (DUF106 family)